MTGSPKSREATASALVAEVRTPVCLSNQCRCRDSGTRTLTEFTPASSRDDILRVSTAAVERKQKEDSSEVIMSNY